MSFDFATLQECDHRVAFEAIQLSEIDKRTARFIQPPSSKSVQVYVDGEEVPQNGLYTFAQINTKFTGPFRIRRNVNDLLYLSIGNDPPRFFQLISGSSVKAKELALDLQRQTQSIFIGTNENRNVVFRSWNETDRKSFQFVDPRWTDVTESLPTTQRVLGAYETLGISAGKAAIGIEVFPGWDVLRDPNSPRISDRILYFRRPILNADPTLEVSYTAEVGSCRRCQGTRIEYTYRVQNSTYETVSGVNLLAQEFDKYVITDVGSHWKWNWYGSNLNSRIGGKANSSLLPSNQLIAADIDQAFRSYQNIKTQQESLAPQQRVTDQEFPLNLESIDVRFLENDPTVAIVNIIVTNRAQEESTIDRIVGNISPFNLQVDSSRLLRQ